MTTVILLLRALHILGGVFWAGATISLYAFVMPAVTATQPDSRRFVQHLAGRSGLTLWMALGAWATVIGGIALFSPATGQMTAGMMGSPRGIVLSIGALLGLAVFLEGQFVLGPTARRLGATSAALAAAGGPPSPEQVAQVAGLQAKMIRTGRRAAVLLGLAVLLMATARYVGP